MNVFKQFDLLGSDFTLMYRGEKQMKTKIGGFLCLTAGIIFILLMIGFGQDFFKRTNPNVIRETENPVLYPRYNITNKKFSVAVRLEDNLGNELSSYKGVYLRTRLIQYARNSEGIWESLFVGNLNMTRCTPDMFFTPEYFDANNLKDFYCPIFNNTELGGSWSDNFVGYFYFDVIFCDESTTNNVLETCDSNENTNKMLDSGGVYFSHYIQGALVTPSNYTNGVSNTLQNEYFLVSGKMKKTYYYYFFETKMKSDYGWILKTENTQSVLGLKNKNYDFNLKSNAGLATVMYYFTRESDLYKREYMKVQTLAANVGGILKIFVVIVQFVVGFYNEWVFKSQMIKYCDPELIDDNNKSSFNKKNEIPEFRKLTIISNNVIKFNPVNNNSSSNINIGVANNTYNKFKDSNLTNKLNNLSNLSNLRSTQINNLNKNKEKNEVELKCISSNNDLYLGSISPKNNENNDSPVKNSKIDYLNDEVKFLNHVNNKLQSYEKLSVLYTNSKNSSESNAPIFSVVFFLWQRIFKSCSSTYRERIYIINNLLENIRNKFDIEKMIKDERLRQKLFSCLFTEDQLNGIKYEISAEQKYVMNNFP